MDVEELLEEKIFQRRLGYVSGLEAALDECNKFLDEITDDGRWYAVNEFRWKLRNKISFEKSELTRRK
jgi:hypothetical protein